LETIKTEQAVLAPQVSGARHACWKWGFDIFLWDEFRLMILFDDDD